VNIGGGDDVLDYMEKDRLSGLCVDIDVNVTNPG